MNAALLHAAFSTNSCGSPVAMASAMWATRDCTSLRHSLRPSGP